MGKVCDTLNFAMSLFKKRNFIKTALLVPFYFKSTLIIDFKHNGIQQSLKTATAIWQAKTNDLGARLGYTLWLYK